MTQGAKVKTEKNWKPEILTFQLWTAEAFFAEIQNSMNFWRLGASSRKAEQAESPSLASLVPDELQDLKILLSMVTLIILLLNVK